MKKWLISRAEAGRAERIERMSDLGPLLSSVMAARGIDDENKLISFFNGEELSDPSLMLDMDAAAETVTASLDAGERIAVYGDYDCDGVCATAILYDYLLNMGADVFAVLPEREDGYGLNISAVERIHQNGASLIITVDNGVTAEEEAEKIYELGMELVVTDHHRPSKNLPRAEAVVDAYREGDLSPCKDLCGAAVALKLCAALDGGDYSAVGEQYMALAAIATVADVVPLTGENRVIVREGLRLLKNTENIGLRALLEKCGISGRLTSQSLAFALAPRINAASRFGSAQTALDMLLSETDEAERFADELVSLNSKRRSVESGIMTEITEAVEADPDLRRSRVLTVSGRGWHRGIIGIIAARLVEIYEKPALVISIGDDGIASGSARSVKGFNVFECFEAVGELLIKHGGHELAGGLTVSEENIPALKKAIEAYAASVCPEMPRITLTADKLLRGADITYENALSLTRIQPCGAGNPEPLFALSGAYITSLTPLSGGEHTRLGISYDGASAQVLLFRRKTSELPFRPGDRIDLMANMQAEEYNGNKRVTLIGADIRPHFSGQDKFFAAEEVYLKFRRGESADKKLLSLGIPTRDEMALVYREVGARGGEAGFENIWALLFPRGINALKLHIIADAFEDTGLGRLSGGKIKLKPPKEKVDIMSARTILELKKAAGLNLSAEEKAPARSAL